ncbi:hypothetical protein XENORESO_018780 [Xenotaenia resolanae]|uniref:Uncharacterized protein n=1 Tax=Xenotaenia resolanae TaxID=208358 RepID=A0ABV0X921_9TELE
MDSLQRPISSLTQFLREFASALCHVSTSSSLLCRRSTRSSAPPTDIHHCNARSGLSLRVRYITSFSFLYCFLIHVPFKHAVFPTPLLHSGRSYTPMHSNISLRFRSKSCRGSSFIWFLSFYHLSRVTTVLPPLMALLLCLNHLIPPY